MNDGNLEFKASPGEHSCPRFFHSNLQYREVIATLRYGIEARKGLILFTGEPGTGKTTLIQKLLEELDPSVTCVVESDPGVNFTDLLRLILRRLHAEGDPPDTLSMADRCKAVLRVQRDLGRIICLIIDNAQQLDELTLEYLMESFFPADAENSDNNNILQVVLAGRPVVREKLLHPWLRPLNPHLGLVCHVEALSEKDVPPYIEDQLRACQFPADAIDRDATRQIFEYTSGTPRLINEVCARALQIAETSPMRRITRESVAKAARDVGLSEIWRSRKTNNNAAPNAPTDFPSGRKREEPFDFEVSEAQTTDMLMQTFLQDTPRRRSRWFGGEGRRGNGVRVILPLLLVVAIAAWVQRDILAVHVGQLTDGVKAITDSPDFLLRRKAETDVPAAPVKNAREPAALPQPSSPAQQGNNALPPDGGQAEESFAPQAENSPAPDSKPATKPPPAPPAPAIEEGEQGSQANPSEVRSKRIEAQVQKAIQNRAISGVEVSVINGTAVLEGRVASERQKQAAERAANSVSGVQRVRNRIVVG